MGSGKDNVFLGDFFFIMIVVFFWNLVVILRRKFIGVLLFFFYMVNFYSNGCREFWELDGWFRRFWGFFLI